MPQFQYKARRRTGGLVEGVLDVVDRSAAVIQLERQGLFPMSVTAAKGGAAKVSPTPGESQGSRWGALLPASLRSQLQRRRKPKLQELATFTQQLANLLRAGMPLTMALQSMSSLSTKGIPAEVAKQLKQDVTEGRSLSDAMGRQGNVFPPLVVNMEIGRAHV